MVKVGSYNRQIELVLSVCVEGIEGTRRASAGDGIDFATLFILNFCRLLAT